MPSKYITFLSGRFFDGVSSGMFMLALPWIMLEQTQSGSLVALVALISTLLSFSLSPFLSTLIDRHSRKKLLVLVQVLQSITALLVLMVYLASYQSLLALALAQIIFWVSSDLAWKTNNAFVQENFSPKEYPKITSYQEITMQITTLGAGAFGIILLAQWSMLEFALTAFIASSLAGGSYLLMPYRQVLQVPHNLTFIGQVVECKSIFLNNPHSLLFLALSCLSYPVLTFLVKLIPIYFYENGLSAHWFATWKVSLGIGALLSGLVIRYLLQHIEAEKLMIYGIALTALSLFLQSIFNHIEVIIGLALVFGFLSSMNRISRMNKMSNEIDVNERGRIEGGLHMFSTLTQSLGYTLIALLSHFDGTQLGFSLLSIFMLLAALFMFNLYQTRYHLIKVT